MDTLSIFRTIRDNGALIIKNYHTDYDIDLYFMSKFEAENNGILPSFIHLTRLS